MGISGNSSPKVVLKLLASTLGFGEIIYQYAQEICSGQKFSGKTLEKKTFASERYKMFSKIG